MVLDKSYVTLELVKFSWIRLLRKSLGNSQSDPAIIRLNCCVTILVQNLSGFWLLWLDKRCKIIAPRMFIQQSCVLRRPQSLTASIIHLSARSWQYRWRHRGRKRAIINITSQSLTSLIHSQQPQLSAAKKTTARLSPSNRQPT